jgi:hypothetical protein
MLADEKVLNVSKVNKAARLPISARIMLSLLAKVGDPDPQYFVKVDPDPHKCKIWFLRIRIDVIIQEN